MILRAVASAQPDPTEDLTERFVPLASHRHAGRGRGVEGSTLLPGVIEARRPRLLRCRFTVVSSAIPTVGPTGEERRAVSKNRKRTLIAGVVLIAAGAGGAAAVQAGSGDDAVASGAQADRAAAAAVKIAGGGNASSVERDAEGRRVWEVEVTKPGGTTLEVDLDAKLRQMAAERDDDSSREPDDEPDEDDDSGED